jgi:transcriptional regulator PpsR
MDAPSPPAAEHKSFFIRGRLGALSGAAAERLAAAGGDVALLIDRDGVICDLALSNDAVVADAAETWLDRPWLETVTVDSRAKVRQLLADALSGRRPQWREINLITGRKESLLVRFTAVEAGPEGEVIVIGRDSRDMMAMQQRLIEAQQAAERDYARLRDAEFRYRLLFRMSQEAVLIVDGATRKVMEANPAAERLMGPSAPLVGTLFPRLFGEAGEEAAAGLLAVALASSRPAGAEARLPRGAKTLSASASAFRQGRVTHILVRLGGGEGEETAEQRLRAALERIPDPFVVTDADLKIRTANGAFLDLVRLGADQAVAQPLSRFLAGPGAQRNLVQDSLRTHGALRNFGAILRSAFGDEEDVEISAVAVPDGDQTTYGMTFRLVSRRIAAPAPAREPPALRRSVQQLTQLVGRVAMKDLVRETTDLVEKLCIEAALELTKDNRASAAEVLGLSRQSLYSKMHRFGLGNLDGGDEDARSDRRS